MSLFLTLFSNLGPMLLGPLAAPLMFIKSDLIKRLVPFILVAIIAAFLSWKVHSWTVTAWVRADLSNERQEHEKTRLDLSLALVNIENLQAAVDRQNQVIAGLKAEAERITSSRSSAATEALRRARQSRTQAVKGVEAWNATVAD